MTPDQRHRLGRLRVLWVSHSFGYDGDLMYFGEIFRKFVALVPNTGVVVDRATPYRNPYGLPLRPLMTLLRRPIRRTTPDGQVYHTEIAFPGPGLFAKLLRQRVDVFITIEFTIPALMTILVRTLSRRRRLVLLIESDPAARGVSRNPAVRRIKQWAARRADVIQTNNARGLRYIVEDLRADPARVRVAPYLTSRPPGPEPVIAAHDGPLRLLFANSINPRKGLRELLAAIGLLDPSQRSGLAFTVVGDGPELAELEQVAQQLAMGDRLRFVGRRDYAELGAFYSDADVLAIPSLADYRSLAGFEGLAYGLALLASMHDGATEETTQDGANGFVIDPANPAAVAACLGTLIADPARVLAMRRASRALYEARFSLDAVADALGESVAIAAGA